MTKLQPTNDALLFFVICLALTLVGMLAGLWPAHRAITIDPTNVLHRIRYFKQVMFVIVSFYVSDVRELNNNRSRAPQFNSVSRFDEGRSAAKGHAAKGARDRTRF
jgi:hypothetical protein